MLTTTFDNGKEFAGHEKIAKVLKVDCYFAAPYSSWWRGSNENLNGLERQCLPKKTTDFIQITDAEVERRLNNRRRKRLGWLMLAQVGGIKKTSGGIGQSVPYVSPKSVWDIFFGGWALETMQYEMS